MYIKLKLFFVLLVITSIFNSHLVGQNLIINGSFDGSLGDQIPPDYWSTCDDLNNNPDIFNSFTFGHSTRTIQPIAGSTFIDMRLRGVEYSGSYAPQSHEYLSETLLNVLKPYTCYRFSIYLCVDLHMGDEVSSYPLVLKVWGSTSECSRQKLLFTSPLITDSIWTRKSYIFNTNDSAYSNILIEPFWDTIAPQPPHRYNGILLLDSVTLEDAGIMDTIQSDTIYYKGDNETILNAEKGEVYSWKYTGNLSNYNIQSPTMLGYLKHDSVIIKHDSMCPTIESFYIKLVCDSLYHNDSVRTYFYKYFKNVTLNASNGIKYDWEPKKNLNAYDIQDPYLTGFDSSYTVTIYDKYNCTTTEKFNILANCDSLNKTYVNLDTTLDSGNPSIQLIPKYGAISSNWTPDRWLSCNDCQTPIASPISTINYSVELYDSSVGCKHTEDFIINLNMFIPNVITPNGDGYNDVFKVVGIPPGTDLKIFDKNGYLIFHESTYNETNFWDGKDIHGQDVETGNYWYILSNPEIKLIKKGFVFLLK